MAKREHGGAGQNWRCGVAHKVRGDSVAASRHLACRRPYDNQERSAPYGRGRMGIASPPAVPMTRRRQNYPHNQTQRPETIGFRDGPVGDAKPCPRRRQLSPKAAIRPPEEVQVTDSLGRWRLCLRGSPQCPGRVCPAHVGRGRNEPRVAYLLPSLVGRFSGAARPILRAFAIPFEPSLDCHSSGCKIPPAEMKGASRMRTTSDIGRMAQ